MDLKPRMMKLGVSRIHKYLPDFNETRFGPLDLQHANLEASLTPLTDVLLTFVVVFTVCHLLKKIVQVFLQVSNLLPRFVNSGNSILMAKVFTKAYSKREQQLEKTASSERENFR